MKDRDTVVSGLSGGLGDSFVPKNAQSFIIDYFGGTKILEKTYVHPVNHEQEITASSIWGSGSSDSAPGSLSTATVKGGTLGDLLMELDKLGVIEDSDGNYVGRNAQW